MYVYIYMYIYIYCIALYTPDLDIYIYIYFKCARNLHAKYIVNILILLWKFCTVDCMLVITRRFRS